MSDLPKQTNKHEQLSGNVQMIYGEARQEGYETEKQEGRQEVGKEVLRRLIRK